MGIWRQEFLGKPSCSILAISGVLAMLALFSLWILYQNLPSASKVHLPLVFVCLCVYIYPFQGLVKMEKGTPQRNHSNLITSVHTSTLFWCWLVLHAHVWLSPYRHTCIHIIEMKIAFKTRSALHKWGAVWVSSECVLLTRTGPCQRPWCLKPMRMNRASLGQVPKWQSLPCSEYKCWIMSNL